MSNRKACVCGVCGTVFQLDATFVLDVCGRCEADMCLDAVVEDPAQECENHERAATIMQGDHNVWRVLA